MGQHLLATVPSIVVGVAFLWILYALLRGAAGDRTDEYGRREGRGEASGEPRGEGSDEESSWRTRRE